MTVFKSSEEEFSSSKPKERVAKLKWWFILLIIIGIIALIVVWLTQGDKAVLEIQKIGLNISAVSVAYAQDITEGQVSSFTLRVIIMAGVFIILGIVYLAGIFKLFFSDNFARVDTAADLVKTLTGFFVGAATGFLG